MFRLDLLPMTRAVPALHLLADPFGLLKFTRLGRGATIITLALVGIAVGQEPAAAQCYTCDLENSLCAFEEDADRFGFTTCRNASFDGDPICMPDSDSELCEGEEMWALSPMEEDAATEEALALVASGGMLPAGGRYFVAYQGDRLVVRRKCGASLVGLVVANGAAEKTSLLARRI